MAQLNHSFQAATQDVAQMFNGNLGTALKFLSSGTFRSLMAQLSSNPSGVEIYTNGERYSLIRPPEGVIYETFILRKEEGRLSVSIQAK